MIILERFEDGMAVLEADGKPLAVMRGSLPPDACEGDVLTETEFGYRIDRCATDERRAAMRAKMRRLIKQRND